MTLQKVIESAAGESSGDSGGDPGNARGGAVADIAVIDGTG